MQSQSEFFLVVPNDTLQQGHQFLNSVRVLFLGQLLAYLSYQSSIKHRAISAERAALSKIFNCAWPVGNTVDPVRAYRLSCMSRWRYSTPASRLPLCYAALGIGHIGRATEAGLIGRIQAPHLPSTAFYSAGFASFPGVQQFSDSVPSIFGDLVRPLPADKAPSTPRDLLARCTSRARGFPVFGVAAY